MGGRSAPPAPKMMLRSSPIDRTADPMDASASMGSTLSDQASSSSSTHISNCSGSALCRNFAMSAASVALGFHTPAVCSASVIVLSSGLPSMSFTACPPVENGTSLDRFLEVLGGAESDFLAGLDLDGLTSRGIAAHAGGALAYLQDTKAVEADA